MSLTGSAAEPCPTTAGTSSTAPSPDAATANDAETLRTPEELLAVIDGGDNRIYTRTLLDEIVRQRARRDAQRHVDDHGAAQTFREPVWHPTLADELQLPDEPVTYRVDQLLPDGGNVLLAAQFKAGKTTTINHLTAALVDGQPFLGQYAVKPLAGRVGIFNYEVDARQYRRWLRDAAIANTDRVTVLHLRGYRLPLVNQHIEDWTVAWLQRHDVEVWIVDPFARAFVGSGESENNNTEVGRFLDTLDVIKERAGVKELIMPTHTGRAQFEEGQERARGATRLDDWADVRWLLTVNAEDERYFRAMGRDVNVEEMQLGYDNATRALSISGSGRRAKTREGVDELVLAAVRMQPGIGKRAIRRYVSEHGADGAKSSPAADAAVTRLLHSHKIKLAVDGRGYTLCTGVFD